MTTLAGLKDKTALITGASAGLGVDFARHLAGSGCHLVLVARREDLLRALADGLAGRYDIRTDVVALDLSAPDAPGRLFELTEGAGKPALNFELRGTGVACTVVAPGVTATEFLQVSGQTPTLYQRLVMMQSADVTRIGLEAMVRGRPSVVPGLVNALSAFSMRFLSRTAAAALANLTMKSTPRASP